MIFFNKPDEWMNWLLKSFKPLNTFTGSPLREERTQSRFWNEAIETDIDIDMVEALRMSLTRSLTCSSEDSLFT